jgi:flagellar biogenesis protein FliO
MKQLACTLRCWLARALGVAALSLMSLHASTASAQQTGPEATGSETATPIPFKESDFNLGGALTEIVFLLAGLCLAAAVIIVLVRKRLIPGAINREPGASHIRLLDKEVISSRTTVHLLEVDGRQVLVCESGSGVATLYLSENSDSGQDSRS